MKHYIKTFTYTCIIVLFVYIYLYLNNSYIGNGFSDFGKQHLKFIEYIRSLILETGDLTPQITMNYGLGQSFVTMYYHGMYNPFILLSLILGSVRIEYVVMFIYFLLFISTSVSMHLLARLNKFTHKQSRVIALLTSFSGGMIFHIGCHFMFIYYFPFMILGLIGLHYIIDKKITSFYTIAFSMVFYTNFFFAPIVSIVHFLYYVGLLMQRNKLNVKYIARFVKAYLLGVLMGGVVLIPVTLFVSGGVRGGNTAYHANLVSDFNAVIAEMVYYPYYLGIGVIPLVASIYGVLRIKDKNLMLPIVGFIMMLMFEKIVFLLNLNMYNELKHSIYFIPIIYLIFGKYIFNEENSKKLAIPFLVSVILILASTKIPIVDKGFLLIELTVILMVAITPMLKKKAMVFAVIFIYLTFVSSLMTISSTDFEKFTVNSGKSLEYDKEEVVPYRNIQAGINELDSLASMNPNIYTSLENRAFEKFVNTALELEVAEPVRYQNDSIYNNALVKNFLGIRDGEERNPAVNPIMYGVKKNDTYNSNLLYDMSKDKRLYAINEATFVQSGSSKFSLKAKPKVIYESNSTFVAEDLYKLEDYNKKGNLKEDGTYIISFDANIAEDEKNYEYITINDHTNKVMMMDYYGKNRNNEVRFLIDSKDVAKRIKVKLDTRGNAGGSFEYSNFKIMFYPKRELLANKQQIYMPKNFEIDLGHSYTFSLEQKEDGYLVTSLPWDTGFEVLVDGEKVTKEPINGLFIGAKLSKGSYDIVINYEIQGFKIGLSCTGLALLFVITPKSKKLLRR